MSACCFFVVVCLLKHKDIPDSAGGIIKFQLQELSKTRKISDFMEVTKLNLESNACFRADVQALQEEMTQCLLSGLRV